MKLETLLLQYGFTRPFTRVLIYCTQHRDEDIRLHDVERATDLRQPEVSIAMADLVTRGWVAVKAVPPIGKMGHPGKSYHMAVSAPWIAESIAAEIYERIDRDKELVEDIRKAMKE